ncbi:integral membrane protein [Kribbella amoyensis]|uniref:Integral membrane protein n=1 Tax=Kribbella amoyensis TaxID=996641 RepID=A0A561BNZ3_9ACTN|nr:DUF3817 domain-containing protein [Kribbella amoyensis]TWD80584.1 integral membrane protein [Kribbella amoyensis]
MTSPADHSTSAGQKKKLSRTTHSALIRYQVLAYVVGVMLLLLTFVAMPVKYIGDNEAPMNLIGPLHGFLYAVYLLATLDLARRVKWSFRYLLLVAIAGTIPFLSFYAERKVHRDLTA